MRKTSHRLPAADPVVEQACLEGCLAGRPEAVEQLFRTYNGLVQGLIARVVGPTPDLEDLVQTTFLEAIKNLPRFRGEAKLSTWLCGIAVHVAQHHLRAGRVRRHVPLELVGEISGLTTHNEGDRNMDDRQLAVRLHQLLDRIHPKKRVALLLYVVDGRPVDEIAALMNATQTATRSRMFFARHELRKLISADPELADLVASMLKRSAGGDA